MKHLLVVVISALLCFSFSSAMGQDEQRAAESRIQHPIGKLLAGEFQWTVGPPVLAPMQRPGDLLYSVKDPSVVRFNGRWHLFCTIRGQKRSHQIEYLTFEDWGKTDEAKRHLLTMQR
jgi:hypothetical protein